MALRQLGEIIGQVIEATETFWTCPKTGVDCRRANEPALVVPFGGRPVMYAGLDCAPDDTLAYVVECPRGMASDRWAGIAYDLGRRRAFASLDEWTDVMGRVGSVLGDDALRATLNRDPRLGIT